MLPDEIIGSLKSLTQKHGVKISVIERECLIPKNSLASVITQKRAFPMKHKERLQEYCKAKEIGIFLGSDKTEKLDKKQLERPQWVADLETWAEKKGFPPSELIEKYEGLEKNAAYWKLRMDTMGEVIKNNPPGILTTTSNGPISALQITKERLPKNQKITQEEAEKRLKKRYDQLPGFLKPENDGKEVQKGIEQAKSNSKELSPFLKSLQASKNGQK